MIDIHYGNWAFRTEESFRRKAEVIREEYSGKTTEELQNIAGKYSGDGIFGTILNFINPERNSRHLIASSIISSRRLQGFLEASLRV